jgi:tetratricopeptide (TPR) repeat protein
MSDQQLLKSAQNAQQQGRYSEAEKRYLQLLKNGVQPEAVLNALVNVCFSAGSIERGAEYLLQLSESFPTKLAYCDAMANLYVQARNWDAAVTCYANFIAINPTNADAHYNYAYNLKRANKYQEAIYSYQVALDNKVSQPEEVLTNMAVIYSEHLRLEVKAIQCLELALEAAPSYIPAMFNLATLYEEEGRKDYAARYYQAILELDAKHYDALVRLAEAKQAVDASDAIIERLQDALNDSQIDNSTRSSISFALGKLLDSCGEYDNAFKYYANANRLDRAAFPNYSRTLQEQLVEENISFFSKQWLANLMPISDAKPIFICGMFRSGSTLIEQVLASHSSVTAGGERDFFVKLESKTIRPYPQAIDSLAWSSLQAIANTYLQELAEAFPAATRITDKRPDNFLYLGIIKALFPRAKIVHSKRQPLDNSLSIYFLRASASLSYATDLGDIAHYYQQYLRLMAHWQSLFAEDIYTVDYDCLVIKPEPLVRELLDFLELPWEPECLQFHATENRVKTASIWQIRQPLYQKSSGRWKKYQSNITDLVDVFEV